MCRCETIPADCRRAKGTSMSKYVDPFFGTEARNLPRPEGLAANWFYIKAQIGNTHPGVSLPHDPVSALPYSGGYPTGYGVYAPNSSGPPERMHQGKCLYGVSHVQQSGTGSIGFYYNFLLACPFVGAPSVPPIAISTARPSPLVDEIAVPGSYSCSAPEWDTGIELVAAENAVLHRYVRLSEESESDGVRRGSRGLLVDVTHGGLGLPRRRSRPEDVHVERSGSGARGSFVHYGIRWYFAVLPDESGVEGPAELWKTRADQIGRDESRDDGWISVRTAEEIDRIDLEHSELATHRAGCLWSWGADAPLDISVGLSHASMDRASEYAARALERGYEEQRRHAERVWESHFKRVSTRGGTEETRRLFYSSWFHASRKPTRGERSNFLWTDGPQLWTEVATMWDQFKTLIPFLATFYPEKALSLARSLHRTGEALGRFPAAVVSSSNQATFERQSRNLAVLIICEVFSHIHLRSLAGETAWPDDAEWVAMLPLLVREVKREYEAIAPRDMVNSHTLDISYAADCLSRMAEALGESHYTQELAPIAESWSNAFDGSTGYMKEGSYYEGNYVHYSFRLFHRMNERIELAGGPSRFESMLDRYFGFGETPVRQIGPGMSQEQGMALGRFDGLNNEVMMETPFAYHFVGRPDKTNEVVHEIQNCHFHPNPGGLAGNDDSGAMTSWYVWNALGLFPMAGNACFFLSVPLFDRVEIASCGFSIRTFRSARDGGTPIYFERLMLNERQLERSHLTLEEVLTGGELEIHLTDRPGSLQA